VCLALGACEPETSLVLEIEGDVSRPTTMFAQLIEVGGSRPSLYRAGTAAVPVMFPATVYIKGNDHGSLLGAVVWVTDGATSILAYTSTERCIRTTPHHETRQTLPLGKPPNGWSPAQLMNCRCNPGGDTAMCPPVQGVPQPLPPPPDGGTFNAPTADRP
jgi:hypothetical protein